MDVIAAAVEPLLQGAVVREKELEIGIGDCAERSRESEATDAELDELDEAPGITPKSRLGCQTIPDGTTDIVVEIPEWNKNYAKEADH